MLGSAYENQVIRSNIYLYNQFSIQVQEDMRQRVDEDYNKLRIYK